MFHEMFDYPKVKPVIFLFSWSNRMENINKISFVIKIIRYPCGVDVGSDSWSDLNWFDDLVV